WHAYVTDFGLARDARGPASITHDVVGTPEFMSPEQAAGGEVDARSDVWSLGATLYGLCAGRPPFAGTVPEGLGKLVSGVDAPSLRQPGIPTDVATIVAHCLERDPARRYPSAQALAADLGRWLDGEPLSVRPAPALARAWRRVRKRPARAVAAVAAVVAVAA